MVVADDDGRRTGEEGRLEHFARVYERTGERAGRAKVPGNRLVFPVQENDPERFVDRKLVENVGHVLVHLRRPFDDDVFAKVNQVVFDLPTFDAVHALPWPENERGETVNLLAKKWDTEWDTKPRLFGAKTGTG